MKFLVDNQLPGTPVSFFRMRGIECQHVLDAGLAKSKDAEIWEFAQRHGMVLVSKDADFFYLATNPKSTGQLVWIRLGNCRTPELLAAIDKVWAHIHACVSSADRVIEVR